MTAAREPYPLEVAGARPVLLRAVEVAPPPDGRGATGGWCAPGLHGLPPLRPPAPVGVARTVAAVRPVPRPLVTEAQARGLVRTTVQAVFDVLDGRRPVRQLDALCSEWAASAVLAMLRGGLRWPVRHATVRSVHVRLPSARAIEASVVFCCEGRHRALALRLDRDRHRWLATAIRIA